MGPFHADDEDAQAFLRHMMSGRIDKTEHYVVSKRIQLFAYFLNQELLSIAEGE